MMSEVKLEAVSLECDETDVNDCDLKKIQKNFIRSGQHFIKIRVKGIVNGKSKRYFK